jgi:hypothetical protein
MTIETLSVKMWSISSRRDILSSNKIGGTFPLLARLLQPFRDSEHRAASLVQQIRLNLATYASKKIAWSHKQSDNKTFFLPSCQEILGFEIVCVYLLLSTK